MKMCRQCQTYIFPDIRYREFQEQGFCHQRCLDNYQADKQAFLRLEERRMDKEDKLRKAGLN